MLVVVLLFAGVVASMFPLVGRPRRRLPLFFALLCIVAAAFSGDLLPAPPANQMADSLSVVSQSPDSSIFWTESRSDKRWAIGPSGYYTIWYQAADDSIKIRQVPISRLTIIQSNSLSQPRLEKYTCSWNWQRLYQKACTEQYILYLP